MLVLDTTIGRWPLDSDVDTDLLTSDRHVKQFVIFNPRWFFFFFTLKETLKAQFQKFLTLKRSTASSSSWSSKQQPYLVRGCLFGMAGLSALLRRCIVVLVKLLVSFVNLDMERSSSSYTSEAQSRVVWKCSGDVVSWCFVCWCWFQILNV